MPRRSLRRQRPMECVLVATDFSAPALRAVERAARLPIARRGRLHIVHVVPQFVPAKIRTAVDAAARAQLDQAAARARALARGRLPARAITAELLTGTPYVEIIRHSRTVGADLVVLGHRGQHGLRRMLLGSTATRVVRMGDVPVLVVRLPGTRDYRRPLIAADLEDTSARLGDLARRVVGSGPRTAALVHAYHVPFAGFIPAGTDGHPTVYHRECRDQAAAELDALVVKLGTRWRWTRVVRHGDARQVILDTLVRWRADLLVVGTHGRSGVAHALLGSVAEWAIAAAPSDVLVARPARFSFQLP